MVISENEKIEYLIYEIRGQQVMLDSDLARLYRCANGTKTINLAVKRHIKRFPERFCFRLTDDESNIIRFQAETKKLNIEFRGGKYNKPYAFTEQGVAMLATVLRTTVAEEVSIAIMDAFVCMRKYISNNLLEQNHINNMVLKHDNDIKLLQDAFNEFKPKMNEIFFEGEIYDAYSLLIDILSIAHNEIIIIDNYIDKSLLDILSKIKTNIIVVTSKINECDIEKYNKQYHNIRLIINKSFHDRFIIIDKKILYHCGSSFKDLGKKCFAINKIEDVEYLNTILKIIG